MPAFNALQTLQNDLIRKTLNFSVFIRPWVLGTNISETTLFDTTTGDIKTPLPTGFKDLGYLDDSGAAFSRAVTTSDVTSGQSLTPTRTDVTADTTTVTMTPQETNQQTLALFTGAAAAGLTPGTNGVLRIDKPAIPTLRYFNLMAIAVDEQANGEIVFVRYLPKALVTAFADQAFAKDSVLTYGVTFTGYKDDTLGFAESLILGGAGFLARKTAMGFS